MSKRKAFFIVLLFLMSGPLCKAQRLASWMNEVPKAGNSTIMYVRESGDGKTPAEALNQAVLYVMQSTAMRLGRAFDVAEVDKVLNSGGDYQSISKQYNIPIRKVDEYETMLADGSYRVWVLCQVATSGNVQPIWEETKREGEVNDWVALAKSVVVPGLGQMGKGFYLEGWLTMGAEAIAIGTATTCYFMAQEELGRMRDGKTSYGEWEAANRKYNTIRDVSYVAWGSAAVVYVFNLYRAFTMQPRHAYGITFAQTFLPSVEGLSPTLSMTYHF